MRLTKHTTTSITAARPSIYTPIGNEPPRPKSIQLTENSMGAPPPGTMPATKRRAKTEKTREMSAGSVGIAVMISCWPTVCTSLPLAPHRGYFVNVHGPARAEYRQNYGETDRYLCCGDRDHQHRVAHPEAPGVRQVVREGDEREVDGVDHQLHAHEHHHSVAPDQHAPHPDGEHQRPYYEIAL